MSVLKSKLNVEYGKNLYTVVLVRHLDSKLPILLDRDVYKKLESLQYLWYINDKNNVYSVKKYTHKGEPFEEHIYMHDLVMRICDADRPTGSPSIIHINRINFDNRYANLEYDTLDKDIVKNVKKKKRTIELRGLRPYNIDVNDFPTYVWYVKPDSTHGERFSIEIPEEVSWRSTSSRNLSIKYKLEETKKYLRYLKRERPDIFDYFCMNGELSLQGKILLKEYDKIVRLAGYRITSCNPSTDEFIRKDTSSMEPSEVYVLYKFDPSAHNNASKALEEFRDLML